MQLSAAAALIAAAAAVTAARPRLTSDVSWGGARAQLGDQVVVLRSLRCGKAQFLIGAFQIAHLVLRQEVKDSAAILVLVVDDVSCGVLNGVSGITGLGGKIIIYSVNSSLYITATGCKLCAHVVKALLILIAKSTDSVVNSSEIVVQSIIECSKCVCQSVGLLIQFAYEGLLIDSFSYICLCSAVRAISAKATESSTAPSEHAKEKQNNPPSIAISEAVSVVSSIAIQ